MLVLVEIQATDKDQDDDRERRREQHAGDAEQNASRDDAEDRDRWR